MLPDGPLFPQQISLNTTQNLFSMKKNLLNEDLKWNKMASNNYSVTTDVDYKGEIAKKHGESD